jgi:hypothetical protein
LVIFLFHRVIVTVLEAVCLGCHGLVDSW